MEELKFCPFHKLDFITFAPCCKEKCIAFHIKDGKQYCDFMDYSRKNG